MTPARVVYRLPELLEAIANEHRIIIVEGERKCDLLWRYNVPATCNPMGGEKWLPEYSEPFRGGADAIIIGDNDQPGRKHVNKVAASLIEVGANVRTLALPGLGPEEDSSTGGGVAAPSRLLMISLSTRPNRGRRTPATDRTTTKVSYFSAMKAKTTHNQGRQNFRSSRGPILISTPMRNGASSGFCPK